MGSPPFSLGVAALGGFRQTHGWEAAPLHVVLFLFEGGQPRKHPTPRPEAFWSRPRAPNKIMDENMARTGEGYKNPAPPGPDFIPQPRAAPQLGALGGGSHPEESGGSGGRQPPGIRYWCKAFGACIIRLADPYAPFGHQ